MTTAGTNTPDVAPPPPASAEQLFLHWLLALPADVDIGAAARVAIARIDAAGREGDETRARLRRLLVMATLPLPPAGFGTRRRSH
jgi:hypothetical protein